jgi:predicted MFS family arabinose efflux permease
MTFTSVLRLVPAWFPARRVPLISQLTGILGQTGQVAAAIPLVALLHAVGWTWAFGGAAAAGLVVAVVVAAGLRDAPPGTPPGPAPRRAAEVRFNVREAWREPGTRLGLWTHFSTQFSGAVFALLWGYPFLTQDEGRTPQEAGALLTVLVLVAIGVGPVLGHLVGRWPLRRSVPTLAVVGASAFMWAVVLLWPGHAPLGVLLLLVLVLATNGPGSMVGFDYARTENPPGRLGSATGIVNVGGFCASLTTILLVGVVLSASGDFRVAFAVQYLVWGVGVAGVLTSRRRLRTARGIELDPFPVAVARVARERRRERAGR